MSQQLQRVQAERHSIDALGHVVSAMQGMAATRAQQGRRQLAAVEAYADTVARAIAQVLAMQPEEPGAEPEPPAASCIKLVIAAEQGFAGAYSERLFEAADLDPARDRLFVVGRRGIRLATQRRLALAWSSPLVAQVEQVGRLAERLGLALVQMVESGRAARAEVIHGQADAASRYTVRRSSLLPFEPAGFSAAEAALPPLLNLPPALLLQQLAREHLFAQLCSALLQGFTAENAARLQTLGAAQQHVDERLAELGRREQQLRQDGITSEIIELAAGAL